MCICTSEKKYKNIIYFTKCFHEIQLQQFFLKCESVNICQSNKIIYSLI